MALYAPPVREGAEPLIEGADQNTDALIEHIGLMVEPFQIIAVEDFVPMGQRLDQNSINTIKAIGTIEYVMRNRIRKVFVPRRFVKLYWTGLGNTKDGDIWAAMKSRFGEPGTKLNRGVLYGITSHQRSALALAVMVADYLDGDRGLLSKPVPQLDALMETLRGPK
jgi:hypothetical protein